jgi:hypothetical protein
MIKSSSAVQRVKFIEISALGCMKRLKQKQTSFFFHIVRDNSLLEIQ